jgi:hypothetical protein
MSMHHPGEKRAAGMQEHIRCLKIESLDVAILSAG